MRSSTLYVTALVAGLALAALLLVAMPDLSDLSGIAPRSSLVDARAEQALPLPDPSQNRARRGRPWSARPSDAPHVISGINPTSLLPRREPIPVAETVPRATAPVAASAISPRAAIATSPRDPSVSSIMFCDLESDRANAAEVLQQCIDRAPAFSSIEIPPGRYLLHRQVVVSTPLTIRTARSSGTSLSCTSAPEDCAVLTVGPDFSDRYGALRIESTNNVLLEHVVIDGNRAARLTSFAARMCRLGRNTFGFNATVWSCATCALEDVVSMNALCGTGMVWSGAQASIRRSEFRGNGDAKTPNMWADGLTVIYAPDSEIRDNRFIDSSDIGLIVGYGVRSRIERNIVLQRTQPAFAGLMLHNFSIDTRRIQGDFRGAVIAGNLIDCGSQLCVFGVQVGPRPWSRGLNIVGGELYDNEVRGAKVGINVDGAGVRRVPVAIFANRVNGVPASSHFSDCAGPIPTEWMNIAPTSVVDRRDETIPAGARLSDPCQLWSPLAPDAP